MIAGANDGGAGIKDQHAQHISGSMEIWRLCRQYTVVQAALLIAGYDPGSVSQVEQQRPEERPPGYEAAKNALTQALSISSSFGRVVELSTTHKYRNGPVVSEIDVERSIVWPDSVKSLLSDRRVKTGFFFPNESSGTVPDYLNEKHPRFSSKLAAAVRAWQAVSEAGTPAGMSPKQALAGWLELNAKDLGLIDKSGKPNIGGIEEVAKVANWQTGGGAPKTPGNT